MKILVYFFLFLMGNCVAQPIVGKKINTKSAAYDQYLQTDEFGYDYFLRNNVFIKQKDKEIFEYKNVALGKVSRIDLNNPLKIVLFYEDFNMVITLDNQLNESNAINFSTFEKPILATAAGIASQNRLWLFNSLTQKIGFFDFINNAYAEITPPMQIVKKNYESNFNTFYWIDASNLLHSCDIFGKIITLGKIIDYDQIEILNDEQVLVLKNNQLVLNNLKNGNVEQINIDQKTIEYFSYKNQNLTIFTNQELHTYNIKIP